MDELEQRLHSAFTEMAEEVSPSHHAWAEQQRRLAVKSRRARRRPALMAAVAAAVVALIAVPVLIINMGAGDQLNGADQQTGSESNQQGPPSAAPQTSGITVPALGDVPYATVPGEELLIRPAVVNSEGTSNGTYKQTVAYTVRKNGQLLLCVTKLPANVAINGPDQSKYGEPGCVAIKQSANPAKTVWLQLPVATTDIQGVYVYVTSPKVASMLVRRAENDYRSGYVVGGNSEMLIMVVLLNSNQPPAAYTTMDSNKQPLEHGP